MDILIKGMEMPVDHGFFLVICPNGIIEQKVGNADNGYPIYNIVKDVKAVALPEHGRLCDLDALIEHETYNIEQALFDTDEVLEDLKNTPVIVEANNE